MPGLFSVFSRCSVNALQQAAGAAGGRLGLADRYLRLEQG